jgi:hypothetical protein
MNKLLATLIAGVFTAVSTVAVAQTATPAPTPAPAPSTGEKLKQDLKKAESTPKAKAFSKEEQQLQDLSRNSPNPAEQKANVERSKMEPRTKAKYDEKAAQALSDTSTNEAQAKANVAASKAESAKRVKMPDIKSLSKEQRAELLRQLQKESTP